MSALRLLNKKRQANQPAFFVARPGFEPRQTEPKSVVLPLYYRAKPPFSILLKGSAKIILVNRSSK